MWVDRIFNVKQDTIPFAGTTGKSNFRVEGDIMALVWSTFRGAATACHHCFNHLRQTCTEGSRVSCIRRGGITLSCNLGEELTFPVIWDHSLCISHLCNVCTSSACSFHGCNFFRCWSVGWRSSQVFKNTWRGYNSRLFWIGQRYFDDLNTEQGTVWIFFGHSC